MIRNSSLVLAPAAAVDFRELLSLLTSKDFRASNNIERLQVGCGTALKTSIDLLAVARQPAFLLPIDFTHICIYMQALVRH